MALEIEPKSNIIFTGPDSYITIKNPGEDDVCFKVKTTVPKSYSVRPNIGILKGHSEAVIHIILLITAKDPQDKMRHKFLIQGILLPQNCGDAIEAFRVALPTEIFGSKLSCMLKAPEELNISPLNALVFQGSPLDYVSASLLITNPSVDFLAYKVDPSPCFTVKQDCGVIEPKGKMEIDVTNSYSTVENRKNSMVIKFAIVTGFDKKDRPRLLDKYPSKEAVISCIFNEEANEGKQNREVDTSGLMSEIKELREQNVSLKQQCSVLRMDAVDARHSDFARYSKGSRFLFPFLAVVLAFIVGLILGHSS